MKWLALILIAFNLALWFFMTGSFSEPWSEPLASGRLPRVASLQFQPESMPESAMSENSAGAGEYPEEPVDVASEAAPKRPQPESELPPVAASRICIEAGWFEDPAEARVMAEKMSGIVDEVRLKQKDKPADPYYWVIIPPAESRAAALEHFRTLQERNIDSYLVREGDQENAISLGLFSSRASAERVLSLSQARGLEATLATFPRNKIGYSLVFEVRASPGSEQLEEALAGIGSRFESVELNDCEGVATMQKNP